MLHSLADLVPDLYAPRREKRAAALLAVASEPDAVLNWVYTRAELRELRRLAVKHAERFGGRYDGGDISRLIDRLEKLK